MFQLKPLSPEAIPAALAKAERYRLLNEPDQAESICEDILAADPGHRDARLVLLLANHVGDLRVLDEAITLARAGLPCAAAEVGGTTA